MKKNQAHGEDHTGSSKATANHVMESVRTD